MFNLVCKMLCLTEAQCVCEVRGNCFTRESRVLPSVRTGELYACTAWHYVSVEVQGNPLGFCFKCGGSATCKEKLEEPCFVNLVLFDCYLLRSL